MSLSVIESMVGGRYQVMSRIASGGMGEVYRAHDQVLGREVAVKVLHPQFAGDRGFVERFRREARAAAILNHPNIVGVYDWGETNGTYFMVMEFVAGHNLRSLLHEYGRLEPPQTVEIGMQVLSALDHAHAQGIVHRDVKPENILIARDGTVKVADFGLARAFADSNVSQADGTVTGTVQYLAPEQIQGEPADPRTDLYSLGVVLFETLTGRTPFTGETSLAIAYKHLAGRVPPPSGDAPNVSPGLDAVVLHATEKERAARPPSARAMRDELVRAGVGLPPAPRVTELAVQLPEIDPTPPERAPTVTIRRPAGPRERRRRIRNRLLAVVLVAAALVAGGWALWTYVVPHYAVVPTVQSMSVARAEAALSAAGIHYQLEPGVASTTIHKNRIVRTAPTAGTRIRTTTLVHLYPSTGPPLVPVPSVVGDALATARARLKAVRLPAPKVIGRYSEQVRKGYVIDQNPSPTVQIPITQAVTLYVSLGPPLVRIPPVVGESAQAAVAQLTSAGFKVKQTRSYSPTVPKGDVISTDPPVGQKLAKGQTVTIVVSKGPKTFPMPNVYGENVQQAIAALTALGLKVNLVTIGHQPGVAPNTVVGTIPQPGQTVQQGQTVTVIATGP